MQVVEMISPIAVNDVVKWSIEDSVAVVCIDSPPVNALSANVRSGLAAAFKSLIDADEVTAAVLICAGRTFIAGADISELGKPIEGISLHDLLAIIEDCPKPVVSAVHGNCLGGGLEVALCTHARVVEASAKLGLPEVKLGLLPGAGGPQRISRLVKIEDALEVVVTGRHYSAAQANKMGFVDVVAPVGQLQATAIAHAQKLADSGEPPRRVRDLNDVMDQSRSNPNAIEEWVAANKKLFRGPKAPGYCVRVVEFAFKGIPFDEALEQEMGLFRELLNDSESQAQRAYFFAERQVSRVPDIPRDIPLRSVRKVGVVGAGLMGSGIATCFVTAGYEVVINEMRQEALDRGLDHIRKNILGAVSRKKLPQDKADSALAKLSGSIEMTALADCDLVIEAVFERMDIKKDVFQKLDAICKPGAILASNTSALDLNEIAAVTARPGDVIGLHFFSPANIMRLLEIVRGAETEKDVLATALDIGKKIGKISVVSGVCPGFIGNRILFPRQIQADAMTLEGVMPWAIDKVVTDFGFPMGPFAMADLAGVDLGWVKEESTSSSVREILNENGRHGQKTRAGYYDYDENRRPSPSPVTENIIRDFASQSGQQMRNVSEQEILDRCLLPMINEGAKVLEEGIAIRASDIDVVWVNGYGWPIHRGGPMWYADFLGLDEVCKRLKALEESLGVAFKPAALLEKLAREGKKFADFKVA